MLPRVTPRCLSPKQMKMEVLRPATTNERRFITSDALGFSHCIVLVTKYTRKLSDGKQTDTLISDALQYCVNEHPGLRIVINDAGTKQPQLALLDTVNLTQHLVYVRAPLTGDGDEQQIKSFIEHLHGVRLPRAGERPQWCVYVSEVHGTETPSFYLAFMHSHAIWDGLGTITLHETFLRALNGADTALSTKKLPPPPIETAGKLTISWSYLLPILIQELLPTWLSSALGYQKEDLTDVWTGPKSRGPLELNSGEPPTSFEMALIPDATVQRGVKVCRIHGARLTGLLNHLAARAVCKSLKTRGQVYHKIKAANAIDLRRALGKGQGELANYVSFVTEDIVIPEEDDSITDEVWESIKQNTLRLAEASSRIADQPVALVKYISDVKGWLESQATQPANVSFGLSNLGLLDGNASGESGQNEWQGTSAVVSQSGNKTGAPLNFQLLSTKNDSMGITATWWPGMLGVSDENTFVREILEDMKAAMERVK